MNFSTLNKTGIYTLPEAIIKAEEPYFDMEHDYILTNPYCMEDVDDLLFSIAFNKRKEMPEDSRLYIIVGEHHYKPTNIMLNLGLTDNFARAARKHSDKNIFKTIYTAERAYCSLADNLLTLLKLEKDPQDRARLQEALHDPLGHKLLNTYLMANSYETAGETRKYVYKVILENNIPYIPVDVPSCFNYWDDDCIDRLDPIANKVALNRFGIDLEEDDISATSSSGIDIRNAVMAKRIANSANEHNAKVVISYTGKNHLGYEDGLYSFEDSLPKVLSEEIDKNDHIIVIFPTYSYDIEKDLAHEILEEENITPIRLSGLREDDFNAGENLFEKKFLNNFNKFNNVSAHPAYYQKPGTPDISIIGDILLPIKNVLEEIAHSQKNAPRPPKYY